MTYAVDYTSTHNTIYIPLSLQKKLNLSYGGKLELVEQNGEFILKPRYDLADRMRYAENLLRCLPRSVTFIATGRDTVCINRANTYPRVGTAHCAPDDRNIVIIGKAIAYLRATGQSVPPILYG